MARLKIIAVMMLFTLIAAGSVGLSLACPPDPYCVVPTCSLNLGIRGSNVLDPSSFPDPQKSPEGDNSERKNVASTAFTNIGKKCVLNGVQYYNQVSLRVDNAYPYYLTGSTVSIANCGFLPALVTGITVSWTDPQNLRDHIIFTGWRLFDDDELKASGVTLDELKETLGSYPHFPGRVLKIETSAYLDQGAPQEARAAALITLNYTQWNRGCEPGGLTPGYWKNWRNHYTAQQFGQLLSGTIAPSISAADSIFSKYSSAPGKELTILKAHLLACQLTLNLTRMNDLPNPDRAYLTDDSQVQWQGQTITVGQAVERALDILAEPGCYTRKQVLDAKDLLDHINNL